MFLCYLKDALPLDQKFTLFTPIFMKKEYQEEDDIITETNLK